MKDEVEFRRLVLRALLFIIENWFASNRAGIERLTNDLKMAIRE